MSTNAATVERKPKWHPIPPPPPSPKILNLPRRNRHRKQHKKPTKKPYCSSHVSLLDLHRKNYYSETGKGKLERLFGQEREFSRSGCSNSVPIIVLNSSAASSSLSGGRRDRFVEEEEEEEEDEEEKEVGGEGMCGEFMEEKWKFQAEILRAECNFLRMEREVALKKLETNRAQMERTLRSAVQTLIAGKKKIFEGKNVNAVLEEEIEELAEKLEELQKSSGLEDLEVRNCNNFDKQACLLQRRLEKIGGLSDNKYVEELQELAEPSLSISNEVGNGSCVLDSRSNKSIDVEMLRRKMDGLSKEMLQKIAKDFCSILSTTENSSVASSASISKRIEYPESIFSSRQLYQESVSHEDAKCTGRCKAVVRRIVEQVRAETEQWSQMQGMLLQVRKEMEELQNSRKFWEDQALNSDREVQCLQSSVQEWKEKALTLETKAKATETELADLKVELEKLKTAQGIEQCRVVINDHITPLASISEQLRKENHARGHILKKNHLNVHKACREENAREMLIAKQNGEIMASNESLPLPLGKQLEKEKRMLRRLKEKCRTTTDGRRKLHTYNSGLATLKRSPFDDIGNLSEL
nr:myosin heavy chain, embryonic smooth muscle isoform-like isoform X1 [Coffea arabica]